MRDLVFALSLVLACLAIPAGAADRSAAEAHFFSLNTGYFRAELADARAAGKKALLVMFEQEGCPGCLYMKKNILSRRDVQEYYHSHFVNFSLDIFGSVALRDFAGRVVTEKAYAQAARIKVTPTFVFYDLAGTEVVRVAGPVETPEEFILLGQFVASGAYKTRSFAQYKREQPAERRKKTSFSPLPLVPAHLAPSLPN